MKIEELIQKAQEAMNKRGGTLKIDGVWGTKSETLANDFEFEVEAIPQDILNPLVQRFHEPSFVFVKGIKYKDRGSYETPSKTFIGLTVHSTISGRSAGAAKGVMEYLKNEGYGCMVMDENGIIYVPEGFDIFKMWGYHAGVSKWKGYSSVSNQFAGMEICCWGKDSKVGPIRKVKVVDGYIVAGNYQEYTKAQEDSLINFILWAKNKNAAFDLDNVVGHDELRKEAGKPGDKQDPGGSLSMSMPAFRDLIKNKYKTVED